MCLRLHARNNDRAKQAKAAVPRAAGVVIGDMGSIEGTKQLAAEAKKAGPFDAVIHNAGLGPGNSDNKTPDGLQSTFAVNSLGPYILTCLMEKPKRLLYLSSGLHSGGSDNFSDIGWKNRKFNAFQAYGDSKLQNVLMANYVAKHWPDVQSCSMDPGWIKTKMGGSGAPGQTSTPAKAIAEYAIAESSVVGDKTGVYCTPQGIRTPQKTATSTAKQDEYIKICEEISGISFPK